MKCYHLLTLGGNFTYCCPIILCNLLHSKKNFKQEATSTESRQSQPVFGKTFKCETAGQKEEMGVVPLTNEEGTCWQAAQRGRRWGGRQGPDP